MHMYGMAPFLEEKKEHSLICILAEIPHHLHHGKRLTNEYPGFMKEPVIKISVYLTVIL